MNHQFSFYMKQKTSYKNNLISLLDQTYPGINDFFDSPARSDGSQKWVDFVSSFWHVDCVRSLGLARLLTAIKNGANGTAITSNRKNQHRFIRFPKN